MIQLALPDFPLVRELLVANKLAIPYFETTGRFTESAVQLFPNQSFLLHNSRTNWSLANRNVNDLQNIITTTNKLLSLTQAPWFSIHLGFSAESVRFSGCMQSDSSTLDREDLFERVCENLYHLRKAISVPIIIENLDYNATGAYEHICEPWFIRDVVTQTEVGLLLDLAHAQVSAAHLNISIQEYVEQLPLQRILQLHISGPRYREEVLIDAHEPLLDRDYELLQYVLVQSNPKVITLEYNRNEGELLQQLSRLETIIAEVQ